MKPTKISELEYLQGLVDRIREVLNDKYKLPYEKMHTIRHLVGDPSNDEG